VQPSTGNELQVAYASYMAKRDAFLKQRPDFKKPLDDIVVKNAKLAAGANKTTAGSVITVGGQILDEYKAVASVK
jgi:hypothetical protein